MQFNLNYSLQDYADELFTNKIAFFITFALMLLLIWVWITYDDKTALIYAVFGLIVFIVVLNEEKINESELVDVVLFGEKLQLIVSLIVGLVAGFLIVNNAQFIMGTPTKLATSGTFDFLYVVIAASWMESLLFWGIINPTLMMYLNNQVLGAFIGSIVFAGFHFLAYGGVTSFMVAAFIFSLIATIGSYLLQSQGFGVSLHFINNWLVWIK